MNKVKIRILIRTLQTQNKIVKGLECDKKQNVKPGTIFVPFSDYFCDQNKLRNQNWTAFARVWNPNSTESDTID
ncbi:hypothetical protein M0802_014000 [Mischocyttarus mexicanus]|nr:hypothetical protein M0802_014000 [Mischocyttarus mexicanus]